MYLKSVENVITLGKLIGLLFLFCLPLLSILFLKTKRNDLARPVMGTILVVIIIIKECASTLYVGLARTAPPTNTNFRLTFLLTRLQEALYEDLAV